MKHGVWPILAICAIGAQVSGQGVDTFAGERRGSRHVQVIEHQPPPARPQVGRGPWRERMDGADDRAGRQPPAVGMNVGEGRGRIAPQRGGVQTAPSQGRGRLAPQGRLWEGPMHQPQRFEGPRFGPGAQLKRAPRCDCDCHQSRQDRGAHVRPHALHDRPGLGILRDRFEQRRELSREDMIRREAFARGFALGQRAPQLRERLSPQDQRREAPQGAERRGPGSKQAAPGQPPLRDRLRQGLEQNPQFRERLERNLREMVPDRPPQRSESSEPLPPARGREGAQPSEDRPMQRRRPL